MSMEPVDLQTTQPAPVVANPDVPLPPRIDRLKRIFWGPNGLRALWRLAIFIALVFGFRYAVHVILKLLHLSRNHPSAAASFTAKTVLLQDGLAFLCVLVVT